MNTRREARSQKKPPACVRQAGAGVVTVEGSSGRVDQESVL